MKDLFIDIVTGLFVSLNWKSETYNSVLVIIDQLTKMVHYELVKIVIDSMRLVEVIINIIIWYHDLPDSIVMDQGSIFTSIF